MIGMGFMHICKNWGTENCHPDVSNWSHPKQIENSENIPTGPVGEELKNLDEICKKCDSRFFETEEKKCPVCGNTDFIKQIVGVSNLKKEHRKREIDYLICKRCKTKLKLTKLFSL